MKAVSHPPGRLTLPSQMLTDRHFVYTQSVHTDIAQTIRRARERIATQQLSAELTEIAAQGMLPGVNPAPQPKQRVRAGIGSAIALPTL